MNARPRSIAFVLRFGMLVAFLVAAMAAGNASRAAEEPAGREPGDDVSRFRRIYAPTERLKDWPRDGLRYVPMDPAEFEQLVRLARVDPGGRPPSVIESAEYKARLVGDVLEGEAVLSVICPAGVAAPVMLDPCNLAVTGSFWSGEPRQPAPLSAGQDGKLAIAVDRSRSLLWSWSLRGRRDPSGSLEVSFELPSCPVNRLLLDLPRGIAPLAGDGIAGRPSQAVDHVGRPPPAVDNPSRPSSSGSLTWRIDLGARNRLRLRLVPLDGADAAPARDGVRQAAVYDVSLRGVDVSVQLAIDVDAVPRRQLPLELDAGLRLTSARYGQTPLSWSAASPSQGKQTRVVIELSEPLRGAERMVRLTATAPVELGRRWRLPEIRPEGMSWQEGTLRLQVHSPLVIEDISSDGARQTATGPLAAPRTGEAADFQCFAPKADVSVVLARPQPRVEVDCGAIVELSGLAMSGQVVANVRVPEGERFEVAADVAQRWAVDSVAAIPADALDDWTQEEATGGRLTIRLSKAVLPARPLRLVIAGHYHHVPQSRSFDWGDLVPLRFRGEPGKRLVCLRAAEGFQLKLTGAERLAKRDPPDLSPSEVELFGDLPRGLLFSDHGAVPGFQVALERQKPSYSATVRVEATVAPGSLVESYRLRCVPESAHVDRLLVRFSQARGTPPQWTLAGDESEPLKVRPVAAGRASKTEGETWEVSLDRPRSVPFEIRAARAVPLLNPLAISLASLPEARSQRGMLEVSAAGNAAVGIERHRLTPVPAEAVPAGQSSQIRWTYSYDPARDLSALRDEAPVVAAKSHSPRKPLAWIWSCQVDSRCEPQGTTHHLVVLRLENGGREHFQVVMPEGVSQEEVSGVWVDGTRTGWTVAEGEQGEQFLRVPLPPGKRFPLVTIGFRTTGRPLGVQTAVESPQLDADLPILARRWTLWLPPGYEAADPSGAGRQWDSAATVSRRLFGPFGRGEENEAAGSPLSEWRSPDGEPDPAASRIALEEFLLRLTKAEGALRQAAASNASKPQAVAWGDLLGRAMEGWDTRLLVDRVALARIGITARTPPPAAPQAATARGAALLQQSNLALLASSDTLLLTSGLDAGTYRSQLAPSARPTVWCAMPARLAEQVRQAWQSGNDPRFMSLDLWQRMPPEAPSPWPEGETPGYGPTDALGWTAYPMGLPAEGQTIAVFHRDTVQFSRWVALVIVLSLAWWQGPKRVARTAAAAGVFAAVSLLLPEVWATIASGAFLGSLAGMALGFLRRPAASAATPGPASSTLGSRRAVAVETGALVLLMLGIAVRSADAGEPAAAEGHVPRPVYNVIIPIDAQEKPTGDKYLVPEEFYSELQRRPSGPAGQPEGWTLVSAVYRGALVWQATPEQLTVSELKAVYDLRVTGRPARIKLPLGEGAKLSPNGALVDGRVVQPQPSADTGALEFEVPDPGPCRLELSLQPTVRSSGGWFEFAVQAPRLATARLELTIPRDAPDIETPTALGAVTREMNPSRLVAQLGPADRIEVRWPEGTGRVTGGGPAMDVEQFLWLKIKPGAVVLDAVLKCRFPEGRARRLELVADPHLRLAPLEGDHPWLAAVETIPGTPQTIRFELARTVPEQFTVQASFLLSETSGVGNLRLPLLDVQGVRVIRRWLAVSVDPALERRQSGAEGLHEVAPPTFVGAWGEAKSEPLSAYSLAGPLPANWSISTWPVADRTTAEQTFAASVGPAGVQIRLDARVAARPGPRFQYRVLAPAALAIDRISVLEDSVERVARWSRRPDGSLLVFLNGPSAGPQTLSLAGHLPGAASGQFSLPLVRLETDETKAFLVEVFREPAVLLDVVKTTGVAGTDGPPADQDFFPQARLLRCYRITGPEPPAVTLKVQANRPKVRADEITAMRLEGAAWEAEASVHVVVAGGLADEFRLSLPAEWIGPFKATPPMALRLIELPQGRRELAVRPRAAVEGDFRFRISGPLTLAAGERPSVPRIALQNAEIGRRLIVLPVQSQLQPLSWETRELVRAAVPDDYPAPAPAKDSLIAYEVVREPYRAVLGSLGLSNTPQVLLADIRLAFEGDGTCRGVASFDVQPAGLAECVLALPGDFRLVQAMVDNMPSVPAAESGNRWRLPLALGTLPQRVEVVFDGPMPHSGSDGPLALPVPRLEKLAVLQTLWTVAGPADCRLEPSGGVAPLGPLDQELRRLRGLTAVMELPADFPEEELGPAARWYAPWARRWLASSEEVQRSLLQSNGTTAESARAELESLGRRRTQVGQRVKAGESASTTVATPLAEEPGELWLRTLQRPESVVRGATTGPVDSLPLSVCAETNGANAGRAAPAFWAAGLFLAAALALGRAAVRNFFFRWPQLLGLVAGAAWAVWLFPSTAGAAVFLVSFLSLARSVWRRWRPAPGPTIVVSSK